MFIIGLKNEFIHNFDKIFLSLFFISFFFPCVSTAAINKFGFDIIFFVFSFFFHFTQKKMRLFSILLSLSSIASIALAQDSSTSDWIADGPSNPAGVTGNVHYANLLNVSMLFYEAQRSGKLPSDNRVSW